MSDQLCLCETGLANTGLPNCENIMKALRKFIFVPSQSYAGVLNSVDPTTTLDNTWIKALLNNADKSLRFYPSPLLRNIDMPKDKAIMESWEDLSNNYVGENIRKVIAILDQAPPRFKAKFEAIRCNSNTEFYGVDKFGNLIGMIDGSGDGKLYPIPMNVKSVSALYKFGTDKNSSAIDLDFEIPAYVNDANFRMITADKFTGFSMLNVSGLLDADVVYSNIAPGAVRATITVENNTLDKATDVQGMTKAAHNFVSLAGVNDLMNDITTPATTAILTAPETAPGQYDVTFTNTTTGHLMSMNGKLDRIDFSLMASRTFVSA